MSTSTIRLQLEEKELTKARRLAEQWGFSSAEEVLKEFIKRFLKKTSTIAVGDTEHITLSKKAEVRYAQMDKEFKNGKNVQVAKSIDEFLAQLNA